MIKNQGKVVGKIEAKYVIISSVSLNATPSRALDILIASNSFRRIGFLDSKLIEPAVGYLNSKIQGGRLGLPAEVYQKDDVVIIQLRSNIRMGRKKQFVQELSDILNNVIGECSVLIVGALPYSLRPDLQIQSVSKNVYYYSKQATPEIQKAEQSKLIKPIKVLIDKDEEPSDILGEVGFIKNILKCEKFPKFIYLCAFSEVCVDRQAAIQLAKSISAVSEKKEVGVVEPNILSD